MSSGSGSGWPTEILPLLSRAYTCEYATLTRAGRPLTYPVTPHVDPAKGTIDISTGLAYPLKADRARVRPDVTLLFSDATGTGLERPPVVRVHGRATVRDADLQANLDRYIALSNEKFRFITRLIPARMRRQGTWYFARIWVEITPLEILLWPEGDTDREPRVWRAPPGTEAPPSDPAPKKRERSSDQRSRGPAFRAPDGDWREAARYGLSHLGEPVLTVVDSSGRPVPVRMKRAALGEHGFLLVPPRDGSAPLEGPACLTLHAHPSRFTSQENMVFAGEARPRGDSVDFVVHRQVGDFSLGRSLLDTAETIRRRGPMLHKRLAVEAARRGQPIPRIR